MVEQAPISRPSRRRLRLGPLAREATLFAAVAALLIDGLFYISLADAELGGAPLAAWSGLKVMAVAAVIGWLAWEIQAWSLGIIAAIFLLIGLEDSFGLTAPLGLWLIEESGVRRGPQGANSQLLRRVAVMFLLLGPTLYLARRAPEWLRAAVWTLIGLLAAIFLIAVIGDMVADRTGTNLDELIEEPLLSLCAAYSIGLAVEWWPDSRLSSPTRRQRRARSRKSSRS